MGQILTARPPLTALALDLDGTLIDSIPEVRAAMNIVLQEDGFRSLSRPEVVQCVSDGAAAMLRKAYDVVGGPLDEARLSAVLDRYLVHYLAANGANTEIYPGVVRTLSTLAERGIVLGVCTNKPKRSTLSVLEALGLIDFFAAVVSPEDATHRKPHGQHVLETLSAIGGDIATAALVGDSETDMAAARDAGIMAIAVTYGYPKGTPQTLDADIIIDRFDALLEVLP